METLTNELKIYCDFDAIDKEYDIFHIKSGGKYIERGSKILDLDINSVKSLAFDDGASLFALFRKNSIKTFELQSVLGDDLMVRKLYSSELKPYILARLFLFSLGSSKYNNFAFNNLAGKLYLFKSEWITSSRTTFKALNVDIRINENDSYKITASACSFSKAKKFKSHKILETYPRYTFSIDGTLRRVFEKDDEAYIKRALNGKKAEIPYLSFFDDKIKSCKAYIIHSIIDKFNQLYNGLISLDLVKKIITKKMDFSNDGPFFDKVVELLIGKRIKCINMVHASEDIDTFNYFVDRIQELVPLTDVTVAKEIVHKEMNIVLIHNREFYIENGIHDPYTDFDRSTVIQCVTLEDACYKDSDVILKTILKELVIKNEIINERKFSIDNWKSYGHIKPCYFGMFINNNSYFMKVEPNGSFKFIKKRDAFSDFKEPIFRSLERTLLDLKGDDKQIVADDNGNINLLCDSGLIPLPYKELFSIDSPRSNKSKAELMAGILDINVYDCDDSIQFSTGPIGKTLNSSIPTSPHIYTSVIKNGKDIMIDLIQTLGVQFVKYNSYTITPYPFKYLREWVQMSATNNEERV